jgi:hypothetical protein
MSLFALALSFRTFHEFTSEFETLLDHQGSAPARLVIFPPALGASRPILIKYSWNVVIVYLYQHLDLDPLGSIVLRAGSAWTSARVWLQWPNSFGSQPGRGSIVAPCMLGSAWPGVWAPGALRNAEPRIYNAPAALIGPHSPRALPQLILLLKLTFSIGDSAMAFISESALRSFPPFQALDQNIQAVLLKIRERLNKYGGFKRPPNIWLIFRSDEIALVEDKTIRQSELSVQCKTRYENTTAAQREELKARADAKASDLTSLFPNYNYRPLPREEAKQWKSLGKNQRKTFWLAAAVRIAERILNPDSTWSGPLAFSSWFRKNLPSEESNVK